MSRIDVLGVGVDPIRKDDLLDRVGALIDTAGRATVAYANVHVIEQAREDDDLRAFLAEADLVYCDGNGVRLGARLLGQVLPERMTGADWIWDLAARAEAGGWGIWWIGGEPGVTDLAARKLRARHSGLRLGTDHGFHDRGGTEDADSLARINAFAPDIVLVGMGTPEQERWVQARRQRIEAPVVWVLGATADFVSGRVPRPGPRWLVEHHEWASRLLADPRRLVRRYGVENTRFLLRIARARLRARILSLVGGALG